MATAKFREEQFSFRLTQLSSETAERLRRRLPNVAFSSRRADVMVWDSLSPDTDFSALYTFLASEPLKPASYSVWVSVVSSSDHDGVSVPPYILDLVRNTRCGLDFSFVACLGDEDSTSSSKSDAVIE